MKLYYSPGACSLAPIILAEWLGQDLDIEKVDLRNPSPDWLEKNPLGAVPALELDDGTVRNQVDAILQYLCALSPESGLGGSSDAVEQFEVHRWAAFLTGDFHPPWGVWFGPARYTSDHSDASLAAVREATQERIARVTGILESQVSDNGHIALGRRTFLDAYAFAMVRWQKNIGDFDEYPKLANFMSKMKQDPGVQRALERERS
ncbi:MAG: glutathione S-transferase N-terminal domain-containing protein [Xanthomonadales bacterium]|nr:glutathione S-transferase N-terminal domain-containing protein [Xanthomonadales bacterium]